MYCNGCNKHTVSFLHHPPIPECRVHIQRGKPLHVGSSGKSLHTAGARKSLYNMGERKPLALQSQTGRKPLQVVNNLKPEQYYKKLNKTLEDSKNYKVDSLFKRKPLQDHVTDHMTDHMTDSGKSLMLIIVISHPNNTEARNAIRNTWAKTRHHRDFIVRTIFLVGQTGSGFIDGATKQEAMTSQDVLISDLMEDYYQLDLKSTAALKWAWEYCHNFNVLVKTDDDSFIHVGKYIDSISTLNLTGEFIAGGKCVQNDGVVRDQGLKYSVSLSAFIGDHYPAYCRGPCYLISHSAVGRLLAASVDTRRFPLEDVSLTGLTRWRAGITQIYQVPGYYSSPDDIWFCEAIQNIPNIHHVSPEDMVRLYNRLLHSPERDWCRYQAIVELLLGVYGVFNIMFVVLCVLCIGRLSHILPVSSITLRK